MFERKHSRFRVPKRFPAKLKKVKMQEMSKQSIELKTYIKGTEKYFKKYLIKSIFLFAGVEISLHGVIKRFHKWCVMN